MGGKQQRKRRPITYPETPGAKGPTYPNKRPERAAGLCAVRCESCDELRDRQRVTLLGDSAGDTTEPRRFVGKADKAWREPVRFAAHEFFPAREHLAPPRHNCPASVEPSTRHWIMKKFTLNGDANAAQNPLLSNPALPAKDTPTGGAVVPRHAVKRFAPTLVLAGVFGMLAGCGSEPESHVVTAPPPPAPTSSPGSTVVSTAPAPTMVVQQPAVAATTAPAGSTIIVAQAPPAPPPPEAVPPRPTQDYAWVPGYWTWRNERYEWMAGHWEIPPRSDAVWIAPRWEPESGSYRFYEGYWK